MKPRPVSPVSKRELEVLILVVAGTRSQVIADQLGLSINTVNNHRKSILKKTGCKNNSELIMWAVRKKLIK